MAVKAEIHRQQYNPNFLKPVELYPKREIVQYDLEFDAVKYRALAKLKNMDPVRYIAEKTKLDGYTRFNLETAIGERYNCGLSQRRDEIRNGQIFGQNSDEPLVKMFERGRDYRKQNGSSPEDQKRESAEVEGFKRVQEVLCNPDTNIGTMMLSISPPGGNDSTYQHNFYDVFTLQQDEQGKRYIGSRRYSSALRNEEYMAKVRELSKTHPLPFKADAEYFLGNPVKIDSSAIYSIPEKLHAFLHKEHGYMKEEDMEKVKKESEPFINALLQQVSEHPYDDRMHAIHFNAVLNAADMKADELMGKPADDRLARYKKEYNSYVSEKDNRDKVFIVPSQNAIMELGTQKVRTVAAACGKSGGANTDGIGSILGGRETNTSWSVADYGNAQDEYGSLTFDCPQCGRMNTRPSGKLLSQCQFCRSTTVSCEELTTGE